jgi:hypothetical protein
MNQFIFSAGIGTVHQHKIKAQRNEWSGHLELQYSRFFDKEKKFSLDLKAQGMFCQTNFDGIVLKKDGKKSVWWDANLGFSVGFTYYIKKRHWDRCLPGAAPVYNIVGLTTTSCADNVSERTARTTKRVVFKNGKNLIL